MTHCDSSTRPFIAAGNHHVPWERRSLPLQQSSLQDAEHSSASADHQSCKDLLRYLNIYPAFKYLPSMKRVSRHSMPGAPGARSPVGGRAPGSCSLQPSCCSPAALRWDGALGGPGRPRDALSSSPSIPLPASALRVPPEEPAAQPQGRAAFISPQAQHRRPSLPHHLPEHLRDPPWL